MRKRTKRKVQFAINVGATAVVMYCVCLQEKEKKRQYNRKKEGWMVLLLRCQQRVVDTEVGGAVLLTEFFGPFWNAVSLN